MHEPSQLDALLAFRAACTSRDVVIAGAVVTVLLLLLLLLLLSLRRRGGEGSGVDKKPRKNNSTRQGEKQTASKGEGDEGSQEKITPVFDLLATWTTIEPRKVYKLKPKYFLSMSLERTTLSSIIQFDKQHVSRIAARQQIIRDHPSALGCLPSATDAVRELYSFLVEDYLPVRLPGVFVKSGREADAQGKSPDEDSNNATHLHNTLTHTVIPLTPPKDGIECLRILATTIDEDILLLLPSPDGDGHSLQALSVCCAVDFEPVDRLGWKLRNLHDAVPAYRRSIGGSVDRYFEKLEVGTVVCRSNWLIATNNDLWIGGEYHLYEGQETKGEEINGKDCFLRCELQTLFVLPRTKARIFLPHLYLYPLQQLKDDGVGEQLCEAIDGLKLGTSPDIWRYKRASVWGEAVKEFMRR